MDSETRNELFDLVHESVVVFDSGGRVVAWNAASEQLYGWTEAEAVGRTLSDLIGDPAAPLDGLPDDHGIWAGELRRQTRAGQVLTVEARRRWRRPKVGGEIIETGRDITGRREAETALRESEYRYRNLFQAMAASFWELDFSPVGAMLRQLRKAGVSDYATHFAAHPAFVREMMRSTRVLAVNEECAKLFGDGDAASLLTSIDNFWPETSTDVYAASVVAAVTGAPSYARETRLRTLKGREFDAHFTACFPPESVADGKLLIGVIDISARVEAERRLRDLQADFAHAARISMLGELTASIAHEVNQPLAAIAANASAAARWLARPNPDLDELRAIDTRIIADAQRAADIIARVREMALRRAPRSVSLSIADVIDDALLFLRHEIQGRRATVSAEIEPGLPPVLADRTQLQQVVVNLVANALQALAGSQQREVAIRAWRSTHDVCVEVCDTGPGLPPEHLSKVFDSFFTTKLDGMGMGLPICRSIVETYGGRISADNRAEGGARLMFGLPIND